MKKIEKKGKQKILTQKKMSHQEDREQLLQQEGVEVRAVLSRARLAGERPNFRHNYWSGFYMADFDTNYRDAIFDEATLMRTDFSDTDLCGASFKRANASYLVVADATIVGADFTDANLTGATFEDTELSNTDFTGATLKDAKFIRVTIDGNVYTGTHLTVPIVGVNPV